MRWRRLTPGGGSTTDNEARRDNTIKAPPPWFHEAWLRSATLAGVDPGLRALMSDDAIHARGFFHDAAFLRALRAELLAVQAEPYAQHHVARDCGPMTRRVFDELARSFGLVSVLETRVNVYLEGEAKAWHHDRNAHRSDAGNCTLGASFGTTRSLAFVRPPGGPGAEILFSFEQRNGDVFAFGDRVNREMMHGVLPGPGPRWSLVLWGIRPEGVPLRELWDTPL